MAREAYSDRGLIFSDQLIRCRQAGSAAKARSIPAMALAGRETLLPGLRQDYHGRADPGDRRYAGNGTAAHYLPDPQLPFNTNGLGSAN